MKKGFTLVELLIVIALIAILSVAVLATINPIEQSNKAKDSTVQNDAAEVMNAYERYYTVKQTYPWVDVDDAVGESGKRGVAEDAHEAGEDDDIGMGIAKVVVDGLLRFGRGAEGMWAAVDDGGGEMMLFGEA